MADLYLSELPPGEAVERSETDEGSCDKVSTFWDAQTASPCPSSVICFANATFPQGKAKTHPLGSPLAGELSAKLTEGVNLEAYYGKT